MLDGQVKSHQERFKFFSWNIESADIWPSRVSVGLQQGSGAISPVPSQPLLISANQALRQFLRIHLLHQLFLLLQICFLDISEFCLLRGLFEYFYQCRCDWAVRFSTTLAAAGRNAPYCLNSDSELSLLWTGEGPQPSSLDNTENDCVYQEWQVRAPVVRWAE